MIQNKISVKVGGPAGGGVFTIGLLLAKYFQKMGLNVVYTNDFPSRIKGGHNSCSIRAEDDDIYAEVLQHDVVICLDKRALDTDFKDLNPGGILVVDDKLEVPDGNYSLFRIPYKELAKDYGERFHNTVAYGAVVGLMSEDTETIKSAIDAHFHKKPEEIKEKNRQVAKIGYDHAKQIRDEQGIGYPNRIVSQENPQGPTIFLSGNDAAAVGATKAGVKFVAEYPMTPSSSFLSFMASHELDYHITTKHTEDEIAAINMCIGASAAGVRAMTATSGGGFALMAEGIGYAGISENPVVIFECQRGGPSTGLPTYTDQSDLKFIINVSQGEFPIIVMTPGDTEEAFYESFNAFNLAELCQCPVVVTLDKHLAGCHWTTQRFDTSNLQVDRGKLIPLDSEPVGEDYKRYAFTEDGISPRVCLGHPGGAHVNSSYEHDETGHTEEDPENHRKMMDKRLKKLESVPKEWMKPKLYGPETADITLIGWGSTKGPILEAIKYLNRDGYKVNYLHFVYIQPMHIEAVTNYLSNAKKTMILEGNATGQLRDIIREKTGILIEDAYLKYDARPFYFQQIYQRVVEVLQQ